MSAYIYGDSNGVTYDGDTTEGRKTHWDPRIEVDGIAHVVQVGIVPASSKSTDDGGLWDRDDGQFLSLDWAGCNRLIVAVREARDAMFGRAE